jgi:hypothetical protein
MHEGSRGNKLAILQAVPGALLRCPPLAVLALRRVVCLALHPATPAKLLTYYRASPEGCFLRSLHISSWLSDTQSASPASLFHDIGLTGAEIRQIGV